MAYTPYDWQQTLRQKADYVEDRLRGGSPVVGLSCQEGVLLFTTRRTQHKIFEIYDRLAFSGLGNPSDLELVRQMAVDFAHAEGYQRSPEDVSIQRVVGFAISPVLKRYFADPFRMPLVLRGLFAQVGDRTEEDLFFSLNYDGEFMLHHQQAAIAGTEVSQRQMGRAIFELVRGHKASTLSLEAALEISLNAWALGRWDPQAEGPKEGLPSAHEIQKILKEELKEGVEVEAAVLERKPHWDRRLKFLSKEELARLLPKLL